MAAREIIVNTDSLGKDTERLRGLLRELRQKKDKMSQEIQELSTMWKGSAHDTFVKQFESDCVSFENLCRTIEQMVGAMENAKNEYEKCDNKVNSLVNAIRI